MVLFFNLDAFTCPYRSVPCLHRPNFRFHHHHPFLHTMSRPNTYRKPSGLSIRPPSPPLRQVSQSATTPTYPSQSQYNLYSPRRNPLPPSPTVSNVSYTSSGKGSSGVGMDMPPPLPAKNDKRLPAPPQPGGNVLGSPYRGGKATRAVGAGAYDNKLVCMLSLYQDIV